MFSPNRYFSGLTFFFFFFPFNSPSLCKNEGTPLYLENSGSLIVLVIYWCIKNYIRNLWFKATVLLNFLWVRNSKRTSLDTWSLLSAASDGEVDWGWRIAWIWLTPKAGKFVLVVSSELTEKLKDFSTGMPKLSQKMEAGFQHISIRLPFSLSHGPRNWQYCNIFHVLSVKAVLGSTQIQTEEAQILQLIEC